MASLSTSPSSVMTPMEIMASKGQMMDRKTTPLTPTKSSLTLEEFVTVLPQAIWDAPTCPCSKSKVSDGDDNATTDEEEDATAKKAERGSEDDPISELFGRLVLDRDEWDRFAFSDPSKNYTRNLVATDNETFTLLILCWNPARESPIHDHPCDGCWMRVCEGNVRESRFVKDPTSDSLECVSDEVYVEGQLAYITDSMGYHKVGNPSKDLPAVTMHLYSPPFQTCKIWLDPKKASMPSKSSMCYYTEYGMAV